jgi:hypothetical protein
MQKRFEPSCGGLPQLHLSDWLAKYGKLWGRRLDIARAAEAKRRQSLLHVVSKPSPSP